MTKVKYNDATINRPDGERVVDADYVFSDIHAYVNQLKQEKSWQEGDRNSITIFKAAPITTVLSILKESAQVIENTVAAFVSIQVIAGNVEVSTEDGNMSLIKDQMITIHPNIRHTVTIKEEAILLLTTYDQTPGKRNGL